MAEIHNVRWPEIDDEHWSPRTQAIACMAAALGAWVVVIAVAVLIWS